MKHAFKAGVLQCMHFKHICMSNAATRKVMDYEFDFCLGCEREMWLDGESYKITPGCFIIRKPGQIACSVGKHDCYMLTLDFSNRVMSKNYSRNTANEIQQPFSSEIWDILPSVFKPLHTRDYANIFEKLLSVHDININENPKTLPLVNELLHLIISDAYHTFADAENNQTPMDEACSYIKNHFSEEVRLDDIAGHIHLCKNYLVRQFKKAYGVSPISYLIRVRMDYAKKLLLETNLPIKTVAAECGYNDPAFFNYYFKKTFSVTPKAYRSTFKI